MSLDFSATRSRAAEAGGTVASPRGVGAEGQRERPVGALADWLLAVGLGLLLTLASTVAVVVGMSMQSPGWQAMAELAAGYIVPSEREAL